MRAGIRKNDLSWGTPITIRGNPEKDGAAPAPGSMLWLTVKPSTRATALP
jgi:hypothetical protein